MNYKPTQILAFLAIALTAPALRAQTAESPPPPPSSPYYAGTASTTRTTSLLADVSFPYAFRFHTTGVAADFGGMWYHNFIGAEFSYYDANPHGYDWYYPNGGYGGRYHYRDHLSSLNLAYRYYVPIPVMALNQYQTPLEFYIGGSAGAAWAELHSDEYFGGPGYTDTSNQARFDANGVAGLQWNFTPHVGLKIGYRYLWVGNSHQLNDNMHLDSGAVEAGLGFRF